MDVGCTRTFLTPLQLLLLLLLGTTTTTPTTTTTAVPQYTLPYTVLHSLIDYLKVPSITCCHAQAQLSPMIFRQDTIPKVALLSYLSYLTYSTRYSYFSPSRPLSFPHGMMAPMQTLG